MTNMRRGFTMIELIFVIVIIGILAAVAIPKLAATRDDARISNIIANTRTTLGDMTSYYTSQGNTKWIAATTLAGDVTNVDLKATDCATTGAGTAVAGTPFLLCDEPTGSACITMTPDANGTSITVVSAVAGTSVICDGVIADPAIIGIAGSTGTKIHKLGGAGVVR